MIRRLQRAEQWSFEQIDASPSQFRKTLPPSAEMTDVIKLACFAGKRMAEHLAKGGNIVKHLDTEQIDQWRRKYGVPRNRTNVMLMVAWSTLRHPKLRITVKRNPQGLTIGTASPRMTAKQMISQFGFRAERMARKLKKGNRKNKAYWTEVLIAMRAQRKKVTLAPTVNLARQGAGKFCSYLAKQKRALRTVHKISSAAPAVVMATGRLLSHKKTYTPTLCIAVDDTFHARCNRPVPLGGTIFCAVCQPGKSRP